MRRATLLLALAPACATTASDDTAAPAVDYAPSPALAPPASQYWAYVTAESSDEVYLVRFDGEELTVEERLVVGYQPTEIEGPHGLCVSPDGAHWYLTMAHGKPFGLLYKYETGTNELVGQVELGLFPATMQVSDATGLLYCVNFDLHGDMSPSTVSIVDPDEMVEVARTTTGPMPHGSRVSPDGLRHYSCAMMSGELFEIDTASFELARTLQLDPPGEMGDHAHHAGHHEGMHHAASKPTWVFPHPTLPRVYVALNGLDQIAEVDLERWEVVRRLPTGAGPYNVEVAPDGRTLVATYKTAAEVGIWDLVTGEELARIPTTRRVAHGIVCTPDARYAFVTNEGVGGEKGTVDVIDLARRERVDTVEVGLQAGGLYLWKAE